MGAVGKAFEGMNFEGCRYAGAWLGLALYGALGKRRDIAVNNVRLALGVSKARANQIARRSCMNFGMTFAEFMHARVATSDEIRRQCDITGLQHVMDGLAAKQGVILLTAHVGNWELMGARAALEFPLTVVARPTSNAGVQEFIDASRAAHGVEVISKYESGRGPLRVLKSNQALGILPDQHAGGEGALLPFFGQPTRVWTALARLAMLSGARVVPAFGVRRRPFLADGRIEAQVFPGWNVEKTGDKEAQVLDGTRRVISELEKVISNNPDQWLWLHRRWREKDGAILPK
jgi:KDO2-lipid IV(A) lauroyltransferase